MNSNIGSAKAMDKDKPETDKTGGNQKKGKTLDASLNMDEIRELAEMVNDHGFSDFEFENENIKVRFSKNFHVPAQAFSPVAAPLVSAQQPVAAEFQAESLKPVDDLHKISSPIVGTFYRSPGPDKDPYVKEGSKVTENSIVCIVEAMKLMNEIEAEIAGEVVEIYVENGQPVEFGQPLFGIRK